MLAVWERRRAEGRGGLYGGQPLPYTVKRWKSNQARWGEFRQEE